MADVYTFEELVCLMRTLRNPGGCPWDAEQTHESLTRYLIEETYEVIDAIEEKSSQHLKEELGDLLLQPVFHAAIAEDNNEFTINDVINTLCEKLIRRHPHVFANQQITDSAQQIENWEMIKQSEKGNNRKSALDGIPKHLPALLKAHKISEKASRAGFDWECHEQVHAKVIEELHEFEEAIESGVKEKMEDELGDLLFAVVNLGRFLSLNTEDALAKTITKFQKRFNHVEVSLAEIGKDMKESTLAEMDELWNTAKQLERLNSSN